MTAAATPTTSADWMHTGNVTAAAQSVYRGYEALLQHGDPRVGGWLLMASPVPTLLVCLTYVWLVNVAGPRYMTNRPAFQLRGLLIVYNAFQVLFSAWIFFEFGMGGWFRGYSYTCQPVDYSNTPMAVRMAHASWWYYFSKFTEFFDTFFFVLRKKDQHVSLLHVVHHGCMPMSVWFGAKFTPGGHSTFFGLLNTFVHVIMYTYYMVAAMGPEYQRYVWWKKHLTTLQMMQFIGIFVHAFQLCFTDCEYPRAFMWWIGGHAVMFFILFSAFYKKEYNRRRGGGGGAAAAVVAQVIPCFIQHKTKSTTVIANGMLNGYVTGYANGHVSNGNIRSISNGTVKTKTNGYTDSITNGFANGAANGYCTGGLNGNATTINGDHASNYNEVQSSVPRERLRRSRKDD